MMGMGMEKIIIGGGDAEEEIDTSHPTNTVYEQTGGYVDVSSPQIGYITTLFMKVFN